MSARVEHAVQHAADALVAVVWFVDAKHAAWTRITDDAPRVP